MPKKISSKLFVLDTNVLLHDPSSLFRFEEHDIYLPMITLEELDNNKKGVSEVARNARQTSRYLEGTVGPCWILRRTMATVLRSRHARESAYELPCADRDDGGRGAREVPAPEDHRAPRRLRGRMRPPFGALETLPRESSRNITGKMTPAFSVGAEFVC